MFSRAILLATLLVHGAFFALSAGCDGSSDGDGDGDGDADGDTDGDIDGDADGDADGDVNGGPGCPPLPESPGTAVNASTVAELQGAVASASPGDVILVSDGTYAIEQSLWLQSPGVTLRGASGNRDAVVIDAGPNSIGEAVVISADDTTVADLTIRNAPDHCIHIWGYWDDGVDNALIYNVVLLDADTQLLKVSTDWGGNMARDGEVACSRIAYTTNAPSDYTNGVDVHAGERWIVRDNLFQRIRGPGDGYAGPTILMWSASVDSVIERNVLVDCFRGIAFGNPSHGFPDHVGGVVRNNFIASAMAGEVAIEMAYADDFLVAFNTVFTPANDSNIQSMEALGGGTTGRFVSNLTSSYIWADRDGASATVLGNVTEAVASWFAAPVSGDLHLTDAASQALDSGEVLAEVTEDIDGDPRGATPDVGADER